MAEPTYRMSMLPFGTYPNEDGQGEHLGFAMPGMIEEPINALSRLFGTPSNPGTFGQGPDAPGNKEDMTTLLMSMYGGNAMNPAAAIPKGALASAALREAPQRMYHGTAAAEDFTHFKQSEKGAFGPGVYLSREPESTNSYAFNGPNPRVMPVDVDGPLANYDQYLAARHASPDQAATIQSLLDQGFSGVSVDNALPNGSANVTNVFRPGTVRSATTGETLFSDTGKPSLFGSALASAGKTERPTLDAPKVNIYDPPYMPKRAFEEDYPYGAPADTEGRLTRDIDGNPLNPDAKYIVGRRVVGGPDDAFPPSEFDALTEALTGQNAKILAPDELGNAAAYTHTSLADGRPVGISLRSDLAPEDMPRVYGHEVGHSIDRTAVPFDGIPTAAAGDANRAHLLQEEFGQVYHDLNSPDEALRGMALPEHMRFRPDHLNYPPDRWNGEFVAEALRAYMADPNYMKTVAPTVAQRLREYVNPHPDLNKIIQFNSGTGLPSIWGNALAPYQDEPRNALLNY